MIDGEDILNRAQEKIVGKRIKPGKKKAMWPFSRKQKKELVTHPRDEYVPPGGWTRYGRYRIGGPVWQAAQQDAIQKNFEREQRMRELEGRGEGLIEGVKYPVKPHEDEDICVMNGHDWVRVKGSGLSQPSSNVTDWHRRCRRCGKVEKWVEPWKEPRSRWKPDGE